MRGLFCRAHSFFVKPLSRIEVMPLPLIPIAVIALGAGAAYKVHRNRKNKVMTPKRQRVYDHALNTLKDPASLRKLGDAYHSQGLTEQGDMLVKRARLRELPADVKAGRRAAFQKGMTLTNPGSVEKLAAEFEKEGATGAASALRKYAQGLARKIA
jgi:hypothetical protein